MVTERKGCGLVHAVNGGFSHACGHCARANEAAATEPDAISSQINSRATVRLTERQQDQRWLEEQRWVNLARATVGDTRDWPPLRADTTPPPSPVTYDINMRPVP